VADTSTATEFPWPPASATGIGSLPGTDPVEAMRIILGELPDLPHLAELPGRGAGAGLTGRTAALLVDLPVETTPTGWRFAARPGRDLIRARDLLATDLDALEETAAGYRGPLKIQVSGPWTLAATIELARSLQAALADSGAVADMTESLAEGVRAHLSEVRKRVPGAQVLLQLDEPALPMVLAGGVPTASGLARLPAPEPAGVEAGLRTVLHSAPAFTLVHCCAAPVPFGMIRAVGADAVSVDLSLLRRGEEDSLAEAAEAGLGILAGVVPATPETAAGRAAVAGLPEPRATAGRVVELWRRLGWPVPSGAGPAGVARQVVLTPACGLAGAPPGYARAALAHCREAARLLPELIEEG
jgi:methionine synthase II (cobalamin-independent)